MATLPQTSLVSPVAAPVLPPLGMPVSAGLSSPTAMTSGVAAVTPVGVYNVEKSEMYMQKVKNWLFIVLAIVVIVLLWWIGRNVKCVQKEVCTSSWNSQPMFGGFLLLLSILIAGYYTGCAFDIADVNTRNFLMIGFVAIGILLVIAFVLFFQKSNFSAAFYVSLIVVAVVLLQTYFAFRVSRKYGYGHLPLLIMSIVLAIYFWDITSKNENGCGPIDCDDCCDE